MRIARVLTVVWLATLACACLAANRIDPLARATTRLTPGTIISLTVTVNAVDEEEMSHEFTLDAQGALQLTAGGETQPKIALRGLTATEARDRIKKTVARLFAVEPDVSVSIARIPRISVVLQGATFRNGVLPLPDGSRLSDALAETGYQPSADLEHITISRLDTSGTRITLNANLAKPPETPEDDDRNDPQLRTGDRITISAAPVAAVSRTIAVIGEVRRPGTQTWKASMSVKDALVGALGLGPRAEAERVILRRIGSATQLTVNASRAMDGVPTDNLPLQPDDTLIVMPRDATQRYSVVGAVAAPGTSDFRGKVTLKEAITAAGGFRPDADRSSIVLIRDMLRDPAQAEPVTVNYDAIAKGTHPDIPLAPGDVVQVPQRRRTPSPLLGLGLTLVRFFLF